MLVFFTVVTVPNSLVKVATAGVTDFPPMVARMVTFTVFPVRKVAYLSIAPDRALYIVPAEEAEAS